MVSSEVKAVAEVATEAGYRQGYGDGYEQAMHDMCILGMLGYERPRECWNWLRDFLMTELEQWTRSLSEPHTPPKFMFPPSWGRQRNATRKRDGHKCASCGSTADLECDHIRPVSAGGYGALDNLRIFCAACHLAKTDADKAALTA